MNNTNTQTETQLHRVLTLKDIVIYGIILIQPVAALPLFGHANDISHGHAVTTILIAMVGMIFTAISYGRMANLYPAAGSAYTYVSKGIHPYVGFIAGWSMFMDYMFIPIICIIYCGITASHLFPFIPYLLWLFIFAVLFTLLNLRGLKMASMTNWILMIIMSIVVFYFMGAAIRYIFIKDGLPGLFSFRPFYDPNNFSLKPVASATALAALTYIGFDGITTLSEEVKNPKRNVLLAAVLTCVITGVWSGAQIYLAQLSWPDWSSFTHGKYSTPNYNIIMIGIIALLSSLFFNYEECASLINFGAFFAFMAVNIASIREYYFRKEKKTFKSFLINFLPAGIGFIICLFIWLNLPARTFIIGGSWMIAGIIYLAIKTKGFQKQTPVITFS